LASSLPLEEESLRPSRLDHNKDIKENPLSDLVAQATQREDEAIGLQKRRDADDLERYKAA
jgi:hypothetical protein